MAKDKTYPDGNIKAKFIRTLKSGECDCEYDDIADHFVEGKNVFQYIPHPKN